MHFTTRLALTVALAAVVACVTVGGSSAHSSFIIRRVVFVAISGQGRVTSVPKGISCPGTCRSRAFFKDETVRLVAHPSPGWTLARWSGWCRGTNRSCTFALTDSHDCAGGACPVGAFGERIAFVRSGQ
ncbi:MAG TPA: hypothetical protein VFA97_00105 [Gaiellaceae bacterium]|nr:hypothetical protein [Gaiellaceae bacterium]